MERLISFFGLIALVMVAYLVSEDKKKVNWKSVITGVVMQVLFGIIILKWPFGRKMFSFLSEGITQMLLYTQEGASFLFGDLVNMEKFGFIFVLQVLPTIIFFSSLMAIMYYLGVMDKIVGLIARIMLKLLGTSGAESLAAAANIFVGQVEAPLMIKPYIKDMTRSELFSVLVGGMASVSGGVLAGYVRLGVDAGHLIAASIMSAPASLVIAKIIIPETGEPKTRGKVEKNIVPIDSNIIDAASRGCSEGLHLALNVGAMLLSFIAIVALVNGILGFAGSFVGMPYLSLEWMLGRIFAPFAYIMGVPSVDVLQAGNLLGQKTVINEFFAYGSLSTLLKSGVLQDRTIVIMTYALCGFANIASIGVMVGGIGNLVPERRQDVASLGMKSLLGGTIAAFMTATVAGILI